MFFSFHSLPSSRSLRFLLAKASKISALPTRAPIPPFLANGHAFFLLLFRLLLFVPYLLCFMFYVSVLSLLALAAFEAALF